MYIKFLRFKVDDMSTVATRTIYDYGLLIPKPILPTYISQRIEINIITISEMLSKGVYITQLVIIASLLRDVL